MGVPVRAIETTGVVDEKRQLHIATLFKGDASFPAYPVQTYSGDNGWL